MIHMKRPSPMEQSLDPDWVIEFAHFINQKNTKKELEQVKKIFIETYLECIQEDIHPKIALQKAKSVALCFLRGQ